MATLLDEAMGSLIYINNRVFTEVVATAADKARIPANVLDMQGVAMFTASMNVKLLKPLETPQVVVVTARLREISGKKVFLDVEVVGRGGVRFASCEGLWMSVGKGKL